MSKYLITRTRKGEYGLGNPITLNNLLEIGNPPDILVGDYLPLSGGNMSGNIVINHNGIGIVFGDGISNGWIRRNPNEGQIDFGSDNYFNFYDTNDQTLSFQFSAVDKTINSINGFQWNGESLDDRYAFKVHTHDFDKYDYWNLKTNNVQRTQIGSLQTLDIRGSGATVVDYANEGIVLISSQNNYANTITFNDGSGYLNLTGNGTPNLSADLKIYDHRVHGLGTTSTINGIGRLGTNGAPITSFDGFYQAGFHTADVGTNYSGGPYPSGGSSRGAVINFNSHSSGVTQIFSNREKNELWFRDSYNGWKPWVKIWDSGNLINVSQLTNDAGYITSFTNSEYSAGVGLKLTNGSVFSADFGTTVGTVAQGNDSRIINGQTSFSWGDHRELYDNYEGWYVKTNNNARLVGSKLNGIVNFVNGTGISILPSGDDIVINGYAAWKLRINGSGTATSVSNNQVVDLIAGSNISLSKNGNAVTINATAGTETDGNNYLSAVTGAGNGDITFSRLNLPNLVHDFSHTHAWGEITSKPPLDNYGSWNVKVNSASRSITSGGIVNFVSGDGIALTTSGSDIIITNTGGSGGTTGTYGQWYFKVNGVAETIASNDSVDFIAGDGIALTKTGKTVTINSTVVDSGGGTDTNNYLTNVTGSANGTMSFSRQDLSTIPFDSTHTHDDETIDVTANLILNSSHNQKTLLCDGNITITIPVGLGNSFSCNFINIDTGTDIVNIVAGTGVTLKKPHGGKLLADYTCNIMKRSGYEIYHLQGELTI